MSKKDRDDMKTQLQSLVYGETEFRTLGYVFEKIKTVYGRPNQVRIKHVRSELNETDLN